jgi:hypothetical protein
MKYMKKRLAVMLLALMGAAMVFGSLPYDLVVTCSDPSVPRQLSNSEIKGKTLVFIGNKSARVPNTGTVWIQTSPDNDAPGIKLLSGQTISLTSGSSGLDLRSFYIDVESANDGVTILILQ